MQAKRPKREVKPKNLSAERPSAYDSAWQVASKAIAERGLAGLQIRCPACHRRGTVVSKWIPKIPVKPLYVVHANGNGHFKACALLGEEADAARKKVRISYDDVTKAMRLGKPFVLFSGGRDSVCTLEYLRRIANSLGKELTAIHADTTAGFPEVEKYVKTICKKLKVPLVTVRPHRDFFDLAKKWGIPGVRSRWCCSTLKIAPIKKYLATVEGPKVVFDGIRAAESFLRAKYVPVWFHPTFRCISVSPIFGWSDQKIDRYFEQRNLPQNPTAKLGSSGECWCGAYKSRRDFEDLLRLHPEIFDKLMAVEKAQRGTYTFVYEKGTQVPLKTVKAQARKRNRCTKYQSSEFGGHNT